MKYLLAMLVSLALLCSEAIAQTAYPDLIVTLKRDSIRCHFYRFSENNIYFLKPGPDGKPEKGSVWKAETSFYQKAFFARREAGPGGEVKVQPAAYYEVSKGGRDAVLIGGSVGYGYWLGKVQPRLASYWGYPSRSFTRYRHGYSLQANVGYFFTRSLGIGANFSALYIPIAGKSYGVHESMWTNALGLDLLARIYLKSEAASHLYASIGSGMVWALDRINHPLDHDTFVKAQSVNRAVPLRIEGGYRFSVNRNKFVQAGLNGTFGNANTRLGKFSISNVGASIGMALAL